MHLSVKEALEVYRNGCKAKCEMPTGRIIGKSVLAGMMIAMGAAASSVAAHSITNVGLSRLAASVVFPVGLMMVILLGAELFTGDCLLVIGLPERDITPLQFVRMLAMVFFGNLLGGVLLSVLVSMSGQLDYSGGMLGAYTIKVALGKAMLTPAKAVTSGILCNILVCAAVLMALFSKSSAATLPVTIQCAEERLKADPKVARFVLPICTTINMNGCAAFILVTSLFVMQQGGVELTWTTMLTWLVISVLSAIGNAGVPMGCYFLTLSLMSGIDAPVAVLGIILPIYTIIDMVETAVNVWSDSCVCAMTDNDLK